LTHISQITGARESLRLGWLLLPGFLATCLPVDRSTQCAPCFAQQECSEGLSCLENRCVSDVAQVAECKATRPDDGGPFAGGSCAVCSATIACAQGSSCRDGRCVVDGSPLTTCFAESAVRCKRCVLAGDCGSTFDCKVQVCLPFGAALSACFQPAQLACKPCEAPGDCATDGSFDCVKKACVAVNAPLSTCFQDTVVQCLPCKSAANCGSDFECILGKCVKGPTPLNACFSSDKIACAPCANDAKCGPDFVCRHAGTYDPNNKCIPEADKGDLRRCFVSKGYVKSQPTQVAATGETILMATDFDVGGEGVAYQTVRAGNQTGIGSTGPQLRLGEDVTIYGTLAADGSPDKPALSFIASDWFQYSLSFAKGTYEVQLEASLWFNPDDQLPMFVLGLSGQTTFAAYLIAKPSTEAGYLWGKPNGGGASYIIATEPLTDVKLEVRMVDPTGKNPMAFGSLRRIKFIRR
jgi:hypothetical protein